MAKSTTASCDLTRKLANVNRLSTQRELGGAHGYVICQENLSNHNSHVDFEISDLRRKFACVKLFCTHNFGKNSSNESNHVDFETLDCNRLTHLGENE